jgi:hypothetical protein
MNQNLPASVAVGTTPPDAKVTIYDDRPASRSLSKTYEHDVTYSWEKTGQNEWGLTISAPGGGSPEFYDARDVHLLTRRQDFSITSTDSTASLVAYDAMAKLFRLIVLTERRFGNADF